MRENRPSVGQPLGMSKGFGFLSFKSHNEALQCLRKLNKNPNIFGKNNVSNLFLLLNLHINSYYYFIFIAPNCVVQSRGQVSA